jgi:Cupin superfamily protein
VVVRPQTYLDIDRRAFSEAYSHAPLAVSHTLVDHPLLELEAIAELADRFPGKIERHRGDLPQVMPGGAPEIEGPPSETVRGIEHNRCWMVFWYIEQVPEYKVLLDRCVDEAEACLGPMNAEMLQREAFLFLSAPDAVTPVHFDPEHNFLLQIRGQKDMNICAFPSLEAEQRELERYYAGGHRNLDDMPSEAQTFRLEPGNGVYVPSFMPHWVQNGPRASLSLSITFRSRASRRAERVQSVNARLRQLGLSPRPPGASPVSEQAKEIAWVTMTGARRRLTSMNRALAAWRRHAPTSG